MFPFLAPIRAPSTRCRISLDPNRPVEMIFYSDIPSLEVPSERVRNASGSSGSSRSTLDTNRPKSRDITKSPSGLSQMSARSAKSSPIPPPVSEVVPPYQRHKNKGLETSSAMMELFGGAPSYSSSSAVQKIPSAPTDSFHGRKAFLQKELEERARWETAKESSSSTEPHFSQVEDHVAAYHRATTRAGRKQPDNKFDSQPGPEYETFEEKQDEEEAACPAAKLIGEMEAATLSSPKRSPVLEVVPLDQPGPDLGDEDEADGSSSIGRDPDDESQRDAAVVDAEETTEQDDESTGEGGPMLVIRGAQVVNDDSIFSADVLVQDGVIKNVGMGLEIPDGCQVIEATGKLLIPAGIDVHTHLSAPESCDDVPTGCRAALAGGTATIVDLVVPNGGESLSAAISRVKKSFDSASCNYAFSVVINSFSESVQKEMDKVVAEGVNSFVVDVDSDDKLYQVLEVCHSLGAHARILPENKNIVSLLEKKMLSLGITGPEGYLQSRPVELEKERISNICLISQLTNCPVSILSVSSSEALESIEKARSNGAMTHPEIATAAVASSSAKYFEKDLKQAAAHMTDIPLRDDANRLVNALTSQPLAVCTSGHRAISSASRTSAHIFTNMATGVAGVEERMAVVWEKAVRNGRIDPMRFVAVTSTNAAKIFNLYPKKGRIAVGADADLVLWDTTIKRKLGASVGQSGEDVSLYDGFGVHAQAVVTVVGGRVAWKDGGLKDAQGEFIALSPNSPYLFSVVQHRDKTSNYEKVERETTSNGVNGSKKSFDNTPARPAVRKTHYDSNIVFGTESNRSTGTRDRNPPGGRSTNLW